LFLNFFANQNVLTCPKVEAWLEDRKGHVAVS